MVSYPWQKRATTSKRRQDEVVVAASPNYNDDGINDDHTCDCRSCLWWRILYVVLVVGRIVLAPTLVGYVHPDEFFQGGQELWFGCYHHHHHHNNNNNNNNNINPTTNDAIHHNNHDNMTIHRTLLISQPPPGLNHHNVVPSSWEFERQHAVRSIMPPTIMTRIPLLIYDYGSRWITSIAITISKQWQRLATTRSSSTPQSHDNHHNNNIMMTLSGYEILMIPRLACTILSIMLLDTSVFALSSSMAYCTILSKPNSKPTNTRYGCCCCCWPWKCVVLLATAWPTWVFLSRPFTNTLETCLLAFLLRLIVKENYHANPDPPTERQSQHDERHDNKHDEKDTAQQYISKLFQPQTSHYFDVKVPAMVGIVCAMGLFTRFTFVGFCTPVMGWYLYQHVTRMMVGKEINHPIRSYQYHRGATIYVLATATIMFVLTSWILILVDTDFYHHVADIANSTTSATTTALSSTSIHEYDHHHDSRYDHVNSITISDRSVTITPWNAFRYNSNVSNLQKHGLHPRWTHVTVNMILFFGPLTLHLYFIFGKTIVLVIMHYYNQVITTDQRSGDNNNNNNLDQSLDDYNYTHRNQTKNDILLVCSATIVFGLAFLSLAPHQEPRFLLPLITPVIVIVSNAYQHHQQQQQQQQERKLGQRAVRSRSWTIAIIWVSFNLIMLLVYGLLHQGGVVPLLLHLGQHQHHATSSARHVSAIIFFHTYMPPTFLMRSWPMQLESNINSCKRDNFASQNQCPLAPMTSVNSSCPEPHVIDLQGVDITILREELRRLLFSCWKKPDEDTISQNDFHHVQLVAPSSLTTMIRYPDHADSNNNEVDSKYMQSVSLASNCTAYLGMDGLQCSKSFTHRPHLTTEDFPTFTMKDWWSSESPLEMLLTRFELSVYNFQCAN